MTICLPILLQSHNPHSLLLFSIKLSTTGNLCHKMPVWHAPPCNLSLFIVSIFFVCIVHVCTGEKEKRPGHWWCWHTRIYMQQASLSLFYIPGLGCCTLITVEKSCRLAGEISKGKRRMRSPIFSSQNRNACS